MFYPCVSLESCQAHIREGASDYFIHLRLYSAFGDASGYFPIEFSDSSTGLEGSKTLADAGTVLLDK